MIAHGEVGHGLGRKVPYSAGPRKFGRHARTSTECPLPRCRMLDARPDWIAVSGWPEYDHSTTVARPSVHDDAADLNQATQTPQSQ